MFEEFIMEKVCFNCKKIFECKADDIENCLCNTIQLNTNAIDFIKNKFDDCLCVACLKELAKKFCQ